MIFRRCSRFSCHNFLEFSLFSVYDFRFSLSYVVFFDIEHLSRILSQIFARRFVTLTFLALFGKEGICGVLGSLNYPSSQDSY